MPMPTLADFRAQFPELASYSDGQVNLWITQSDPFFDQCRWDSFLFLGVLYWVAHQLTVSTSVAASKGLVDDGVMKKVGDIAKTRDATLINKQADNPYYATRYGQQYLLYQKMVGFGGLSV